MEDSDHKKSLLKQAAALDTQARTLLLETVDDVVLRSELETLLGDENALQAYLSEHNAQTLKPGTKINRIRIEKMLGEGGMGSVFLGFDEKLERQVAIKAIRPEHLANPATQARFVREAQIMSKINHPAICQLYDYLEEDVGDFLVMEFIDGEPLFRAVLTEQQKYHVLAQLAQALAVAHEHGIVHRDLKPDNIMIKTDGSVKVLDFGIAQSLHKPSMSQKSDDTHLNAEQSEQLTQHGSLVGTIRYMSPEQAQGQSINTASDIYAMGIIAQELFTHQSAYPVMVTEQLLKDVQTGQRIQPKDLPDSLAKLISRMTALDAFKRPSALAVDDALNHIIQAPKRRKKKLLLATGGVIAVILLLVLGWQSQQLGSQAERNQQINQFENQIEQLVKQSEQIYVLPLHPVQDEITSLLAQAETLYAEIENNQVLSETEKLRLQGIITLKAEYYEDAIPLLERGQAEASLLAQAWSQLYIETASEHSDLFGFEQAMNDAELNKNYLQPALKYIQLATAETQDPLLAAFELTQTQSLQAGLDAVDQILSEQQWNKDAVKLKALILSAMMQTARENGQWAEAKILEQQTVETYRIATEMARSYPPAYVNLCYHTLGLLADATQRTGQEVTTLAEQAINACESVLVTQPNHVYAKQLLSRIYLLLAQWQMSQGSTDSKALVQAAEWNDQTQSLDNVFAFTWNQALIEAIQAQERIFAGKSQVSETALVLKKLDKLLLLDTPYKTNIIADQLFVLALKAHSEIIAGVDPTTTIKQAQKRYEKAILTPDLLISDQWYLTANMAHIHGMELVYLELSGANLTTPAEQLIAMLQPADEVSHKEPNLLTQLANAHAMLAQYRIDNRLDIGSHLKQAQVNLDAAIKINPNDFSVQLSRANLLSLQAALGLVEWDQPEALFTQLTNQVGSNIRLNLVQAEHLLRMSRFSKAKKQAQMARERGLQVISEALKLAPNHALLKAIKTELTSSEYN